jgi:hypothetical protein
MSTHVSPTGRPRTAVELNAAGLDALIRALGIADAARFLQQYGPGIGDYTTERDSLLGGLSMDDVLRLTREHERP